MAAAKGELDKVQPLRWSKDTAVAVVVAAENYPDTPRTGRPHPRASRRSTRSRAST